MVRFYRRLYGGGGGGGGGGVGGGGQVCVLHYTNICKISRPLQLELYLRDRSLLTYHFHSVDGSDIRLLVFIKS